MLAPAPVAGIDVGKSFLDLGFEPAARPLRVRNDPAGIAALIEALRRRSAARIALEAIGPYAWPLTAALVAAGFEVDLADPRQVRAFRTAEGRFCPRPTGWTPGSSRALLAPCPTASAPRLNRKRSR
jgi:transposase